VAEAVRVSVRLSVLVKLRLKLKKETHGVENRRRFSTPKTDMAEKDDDAVAAAAIMHL